MTAKPATERAEEERERSVRALGAQPLGASAGMLLL